MRVKSRNMCFHMNLLFFKKMDIAEMPNSKLVEPVKGSHGYDYKILGRDDMTKRMPLSVTGIVNCVFPFDFGAKALEIVNGYLVRDKPPFDMKLREIFDSTRFAPGTSYEKKRDVLQKRTTDFWNLSATYGTRVHSLLENYIRKNVRPGKGELDPREQKSFDFGVAYLENEAKCGFMPLHVELNLAAPSARTRFHKPHDPSKPLHLQECCGFAGCVDLILYNAKTKKYKICDWKTSKRSTGDFLADTRQKWMLQLGLYHYLIGQALPAKYPYNVDTMVVFQINPDYSERHVFSVRDCEIAVNVALWDNVFLVPGWSKLETWTGRFTANHKCEDDFREEPNFETI
jgi:hypothetical protein